MISQVRSSLLAILLLIAMGGVAASVRLVPGRPFARLGSTREFKPEAFDPTLIDSLRQQHPRSRLHPAFELPALIALSFYPELRDIELSITFGKINTTMQCQPRPGTLLGKKPRVYEILVNNDSTFDGVHLWDVPFNAQIGVIGHELAHIVDYERHSSLGVAGIGLDYLSEKGKTRIEHHVDSITVRHGLGWQLHDWAHFVLEESKATEAYKAFKRTVYMRPEEIAAWLASDPTRYGTD